MPSKRILVFGATGTIGSAVAAALSHHEVIPVSRQKARYKADLTDAESVRAMFDTIGKIDAIVCAAGEARFKPLDGLTDDDFRFSIASKLMGQVNLARIGMHYLNDGGAIVLTSGILANKPMPGSAAISLVNAGLEGFARAAALEAPRGIRVNIVSPPWVAETLRAMGKSPAEGKPAAEVARAYVDILEGKVDSGIVVLA